MQTVNIPGVGDVDFPDSMSNEDIENAIKTKILKNYAPKAASTKLSAYQKYLAPTVDASVEGLERAGAGIGQLVYPGIDKLAGTNLEKTMEASRNANAQAFNQKYQNDPYTRGMADIAEIAPSFIGGAGIEAASGTLPEILLKNAAIGGATGAINYDPTGKNIGAIGAVNKAIPGAIYGGALGSAVSGFANAPNIVRKALSGLGSISPDELKTINSALGKTGASLGDVIDSASLKHLQENILPVVPFAGVEKTQIKRAKELINEGDNLVNSLKVDKYADNPGAHIKDVLMKNSRLTSNESKDLYNKVDEIAQSKGIKISGNNYQKAAQSILNELNNDFTPDLEDSDISNLRSQLSKIVSKDKNGQIKNANIAKSILNDKAAKNFSFQNDYLGGAYSRLANGLDEDIKNSINRSNDNELMDAYKTAQEHYKNNVVPFQDRDIAKFVRENADSDTIINHFLRTNTDRSNLLNKLLNKTSGDEKNAIAHSFLKKAYIQKANNIKQELSPAQLVNIYNRLGDRTKKSLFDKNFRDKMRNYSIKVKKNMPSLDVMSNPKTGYRNLDYMKGSLGTFLGGAALYGHPLSSGALMGAARLTNNALNSKILRELYLKGLLTKSNPGNIAGGIAGLGSGLYNQ